MRAEIFVYNGDDLIANDTFLFKFSSFYQDKKDYDDDVDYTISTFVNNL